MALSLWLTWKSSTASPSTFTCSKSVKISPINRLRRSVFTTRIWPNFFSSAASAELAHKIQLNKEKCLISCPCVHSIIRSVQNCLGWDIKGCKWLNIPVPIPDEEKKLSSMFIFTLLCGTSKGFMQALKANFIKKEILAQVFSCKFCEISKNSFFTADLWTTASVNSPNRSLKQKMVWFKHCCFFMEFLPHWKPEAATRGVP